MSSTLLIKSIDVLVASKDLGELAAGVVDLTQRLLETHEVLVTLRGAEQESVAGAPSNSPGLQTWAAELLEAEPTPGIVRAEGRAAAQLQPTDIAVRGVIAVSAPDCVGEDEQAALLGALADLAATCGAQIVRRMQADRALQDTRAMIARGLHDLCTPLNSLRLGMHLLEPALTTKDPAVAQRTHRAVDRMAALVTTMADAIGNDGARA